jgi:hypothetical protein
VQAAIAADEANADEANANGDGAGLHILYERMEAIDGYGAEARAARLLHGVFGWLAHATQSCTGADVPLRHPAAR